MTPQEPDFEPGHPARCDFDPNSEVAQEWVRKHYAPKGERDFAVGHPKAEDTPGNSNAVPVLPGVNPEHPEREAFSGRTREQVESLRELHAKLAKETPESPLRRPIFAPKPPPPIERPIPPGQPGE